MHNCFNASTISRALSVFLACLIAAPMPAQTPAVPTQINIVILEGEGAINAVRQRVARETMVQVEDQNHKPVAGAAVTFFLPNEGASGVFSNGSRSITILTDAEGKAAPHMVRVNSVAGNMQMRVEASYQGLTKSALITQTNMVGYGASAGGLISGKLLAILLIGAAGAAVGGVLAANSGGKSSPAAAAGTATGVAVGTPTVGAPK
jgi:hypothetical protein